MERKRYAKVTGLVVKIPFSPVPMNRRAEQLNKNSLCVEFIYLLNVQTKLEGVIATFVIPPQFHF